MYFSYLAPVEGRLVRLNSCDHFQTVASNIRHQEGKATLHIFAKLSKAWAEAALLLLYPLAVRTSTRPPAIHPELYLLVKLGK